MLIPIISVIVAAHNEEKFIGRCLRSLLDQSFPRSKYEIIVVDDASQDRTDYALGLFREDLVLLRNEKQLGLPASLNRAIHKARGQYIVRVDGDDYVNRNYLYLLQLFLGQNGYMDALACDYFLVDDNEEILDRKNCLEYPIGCGIMFQTKHLIEVGLYDKDFLLHEDKDLRQRFLEKYAIHRIELPLYRYRRHLANMTNNSGKMQEYSRRLEIKHGDKIR